MSFEKHNKRLNLKQLFSVPAFKKAAICIKGREWYFGQN